MTGDKSIINYINQFVHLTDEEAVQFSACFKEVKNYNYIHNLTNLEIDFPIADKI